MNQLIELSNITNRIFTIRGVKVMLDRDLAELYGVETKRLKEQVRRNIDRFPLDFMFELTKQEFADLRSQIASSSWGGPRYVPMAFTEQEARNRFLQYHALRTVKASPDKHLQRLNFTASNHLPFLQEWLTYF